MIESSVDIVVVGEELFEEESDVEKLPRDLCTECCSDNGGPGVITDADAFCSEYDANALPCPDKLSDMSVSNTDRNTGISEVELLSNVVGLACDLQNGYRRFNDNDIRLSALFAGGLRFGSLNGFSRSEGEETSL